uniref:2S seed storage protein-like n=1 Tax=Erigeron canadensis TaxID=72917 RepID=UPI001CB91E1E|nr:2S seed storage protein-like [Erigeron canadensis]
MAKPALIALALAAFVVILFTEVSSHRTTITTTTTTNDDNPFWDQPQYCQRQIPIQEVNYCQMHLTQGIISSLDMVVENRRPSKQTQQGLRQQCCNQLNRVEAECQCNAIQIAYDEARVQGDVIQMRQMLSKAYSLMKDCDLQVQDCAIASPRV